MARCDEGYDCDICGEPVEAITDSELYLRYVVGDVKLEELHRHPERHIRCNPGLAQYIVDAAFTPVECVGPFAKSGLDSAWVRAEESRITRGWRRLQTIPTARLTVAEYPLHITPDETG